LSFAETHDEPEFRRSVEHVLESLTEVLGTRTAFVSWFDEDIFRVTATVDGAGMGFEQGDAFPLADSMCSRYVAGAAKYTTDAASDPDYAAAPARERFGIRTYAAGRIAVGGELVGTLCVLDPDVVNLSDEGLVLLDAFAELVGHLYSEHQARQRVRRLFLRLSAETRRRELLVRALVDDLAEPLDAISALADLADTVASEAVRADALRMAGAHASRVETLLESLGVTERSDDDAPSPEVTDLGELLQQVRQEAEDLVGEGVTVQIDGGGIVETQVDVLHRLVSLLVLAAAERATTGTIAITAEADAHSVLIEVTDDGPQPEDDRRPLATSLIERLASQLDARIQRPEVVDGNRVGILLRQGTSEPSDGTLAAVEAARGSQR